MLENIQEFLRVFYINMSPEMQTRLISTLTVLFILLIVRFVAMRVVFRRYHGNTRALYNWRKAVQYTIIVVGVLLIGRIWLEGVQSVATYLGLVSAGLAIALTDPVTNVAGWLFILSRRPFVVGDRIQIGERLGDVIDISFFQFSMIEVGGGRINAEQSTGRVIHVPNGRVFKEPVVNTHQGVPFIWNEIPVLITFESDWRKAKKLVEAIINRLAPDVSEAIQQYAKRADKRFVISYGNVTPTVYTAVVDSGVLLTMRYMIDPRKRRNSEMVIWEAVLDAFEHHYDIDFAYPTQREYIHFQERPQPPDPQDAPTIIGNPVEWLNQRHPPKKE
ncbi:MAG: mechanosensitive ion channel family protein [Anaerolineales bacterium]|nr:mechanosensitive ion channel family protein [Anaerolineales bacterium]MCA9930340.1 mechanosensitive ion channel family protein [Anaerolineales bacterium]